MKSKSQQNIVLLVGAAGLIALVIFGAVFSFGQSGSGQAQEPTPILQIPEPTPLPTVPPAPTDVPRVAGVSLVNLTFDNAQALQSVELVELDQVLPDSRSNWIVRDGRLVQDRTGRTRSSSIQQTAVLAGKAELKDYTVSTKFYDEGNGTMGLIVRRQGNSFYRFSMLSTRYTDNPKLLLEKVVDGQATPLWQSNEGAYEPLTWYTVSMSAVGSKLQVRINDKVIAEVTDSTLSSGQAGIYTRALGGIMFDDLAIVAP
ncbi:MAG: DUF1080 domain-containing protein [Chloroflexaceae bacterium]|jgi:hypothetical protein|nr:DUF1080 domain-containing protein [Chloroflexaceae bacterium]